ncbi:MAG: SDR family NAD(P)-dependent oxidoreductase [Ignavibacteria bacterium]|nr:SDR family NAD(P)-dependent oxidoreductase [Ignavibacteria bacterium]
MNEILDMKHTDPELDIAIIGMAGRFPGAKNLDEYWKLLSQGKESVTFFSDEELKESGVSPSTYNDPNFIKAAPILEDADKFDASFFGYSPRDARYMDPQQRLFLELASCSLEDGGYDPDKYQKPIGVFGGTAMNTYFLFSGLTQKFVTEYIPTLLGNDKDFLATKVSYKLNLKGPSLNIQSACSTSLVAVHLACQSLLSEECDMALAGATAIRVPLNTGHYYQESGIHTRDGHCRPFDANASGTIFGSGGGVVLLKKLKNALNDKDNIYALIKGSAINNDGRTKVDYTAPSVEAQAHVIIEAQANAGVKADQIQYVEAHGTGTFLGDPIEITALTKAFRTTTDNKGFCAIGSVKSNIGHLDAAAGIAGLIKTVLALKNKKIPPSINFDSPNPEIDFENSPFFVNSVLSSWKNEDTPLRAGISSLGIGGTNAHIVLEEAPKLLPAVKPASDEILFLSARSDSALNELTSNLANHLTNNPDNNLSDVAFTLREGRKIFDKKRIVVSNDSKKLVEVLKSKDSEQILDLEVETLERDVVFLFPGGGAQHINMGRELYNKEQIFKNEVDKCLAIANKLLNKNLKEVLFPEKNQEKLAATQITKPTIGLATLFIIEYAMAKYLMSLGIKPSAMIGHSLGEYTAACIAGVLNLEDALYMVTKRSELFQKLPVGAMTSVPLNELELKKYFGDELSIAVINTPSISVASGPIAAIEEMEKSLTSDGIDFRRLKISTASHSKMVEPILNEFYEAIKEINFGKPAIPFASNMSGKLIENLEASNPNYWVDHIRSTVRFADGIKLLLEQPHRVLLEVGPNTTLTALANQSPTKKEEQLIISSMRHPLEELSDNIMLLKTIGQLHFAGVKIDWDKFYNNLKFRRVSLPTYPFERKKHWYKTPIGQKSVSDNSLDDVKDFSEWFFSLSWKRSTKAPDQITPDPLKSEKWLIFSDGGNFAGNLIEKLQHHSQEVIVVLQGDIYNKISDNEFVIDKKSNNDFKNLFENLKSVNFVPDKIVHFWNSEFTQNFSKSNDELKDRFYDSVYSLFFISNALLHAGFNQKIQIGIISTNLHSVIGNEKLNSPEHSVLFGPSKVINKEFPNVFCKNIDLSFDEKEGEVSHQIIEELLRDDNDEVIAYRGKYRWTQAFENIKLKDLGDPAQNLTAKRKTILITGGTGGIGLEIATYFSQISNSNLILTKRSSFPDRTEWNDLLRKNGEDGKISEIIKKIYEIEKSGSTVEIIVSDVNDKKAIGKMALNLKEKYGKIDVVIHSAGIIDDNLLVNKNIEMIDKVLSPKVFGTLNIYQAMKDFEPGLFVLFSSVNSLLAPAGQFDYSAANNYLDAFANHFNSLNSTKFISINWPGWKEVGIVANLKSEPGNNSWKEESIKKSITNAEGVKAFNSILNETFSQVIISPGGEADLSRSSKKLFNAVSHSSDEVNADIQSSFEGLTDSEKPLALIWVNALGVEHISKKDNFFKLGGNSLLAIQVISRIQEIYSVTLSIGDIFKYPTLEKLASKIENEIFADINDVETGSDN